MIAPRLLRRIRALQRLRAGGATHGETEAAAHALGKILLRHAMAEADLEAAGAVAPEDVVLDPEPLAAVPAAEAPYWMTALALTLAEHHGLACFVGHRRRAGKRERLWVLAGRPTDIATVRHLWAWLSCEAVRLCEREAPAATVHFRDSFCVGFAQAIGRQLDKAKLEIASEAPSSQALLVLDGRTEAAQLAVRGRLGPIPTATIGPAVIDIQGLLRGRAVGHAIHLGETIGGGQPSDSGPTLTGPMDDSFPLALGRGKV